LAPFSASFALIFSTSSAGTSLIMTDGTLSTKSLLYITDIFTSLSPRLSIDFISLIRFNFLAASKAVNFRLYLFFLISLGCSSFFSSAFAVA
jgi:hypothetical protein